MSAFRWTKSKRRAAELLSEGKLTKEAAQEIGVDERTVRRWRADISFSEEVDRLSLVSGVATSAFRLRLINRVIAQFEKDDGSLVTRKDAADWIKLAQEESKAMSGERLMMDDFSTVLERVYGAKKNG